MSRSSGGNSLARLPCFSCVMASLSIQAAKSDRLRMPASHGCGLPAPSGGRLLRAFHGDRLPSNPLRTPGTPWWTRTTNHRLRRAVLYPVELTARRDAEFWRLPGLEPARPPSGTTDRTQNFFLKNPRQRGRGFGTSVAWRPNQCSVPAPIMQVNSVSVPLQHRIFIASSFCCGGRGCGLNLWAGDQVRLSRDRMP